MLKCSVLSFHASAAFAGFQERVDASWESNQKVAASLWKLFPFISRPYFFSKGYSHRVEPCCNMPYRAESSLPLPWNEHSDSCWYNGASKNVYIFNGLFENQIWKLVRYTLWPKKTLIEVWVCWPILTIYSDFSDWLWQLLMFFIIVNFNFNISVICILLIYPLKNFLHPIHFSSQGHPHPLVLGFSDWFFFVFLSFHL